MYKQLYNDGDTHAHYESDWQPWWIEYRESGVPNLHLEGMRTVDGSGSWQAGGGNDLWYDFCEKRVISMRDEAVLLVLGVLPDDPLQPLSSIELRHLLPDPDSDSSVFRLQTPTDPIFADSFETEDFTAWSMVVDSSDVDTVRITPVAGEMGKYGMQVTVSGDEKGYVRDDTPNREPLYRARFYFDPTSAVIPEGNILNIFVGYDTGSPSTLEIFRVQLRFDRRDGYRVRVQVLKDNSSYISTQWYKFWYSIDGPANIIEVDWGNDGSCGLSINGSLKKRLYDLDNNSQRIDMVSMGKVTGEGTSGELYFDAFESRRETYIGP